MKRIVTAVCMLAAVMAASAQTNKTIKELQNRRSSLQKDIARSEEILLSTKKDVSSQLSNLSVLNGQISARAKLITSITGDVKSLDAEIGALQKQVNVLERQLKDKKDNYATSLNYLHKKHSIQEKLLFIFSADDLNQLYRRMRYVQEYGNFQKRQAEDIQRKKEEISEKESELREVRMEKSGLLDMQKAEQGKLEEQQKKQRTLVANLQKKQKSLQSEISRKRKQADKLNAEIDRLIEAEIEAARKLAAKKGGKSSSSGKGTASGSKARPMDAYKVDDDNRKLSGSFEKNKGRLPVPITGGYMVVSHYGRHNVAGLKHVEIDNKGVDIKGRSGAQARAVFDGEVSAVFQYNGMTNVLVRHGSYISVYCNLSSASVQRGQKVKARQSLGPVATDASGNIILHFQLRRETTKLNPEAWINV